MNNIHIHALPGHNVRSVSMLCQSKIVVIYLLLAGLQIDPSLAVTPTLVFPSMHTTTTTGRRIQVVN